MGNKNLATAKNNKNDEWYTRLVDIEKELKLYSNHLKDKTIYCNCDSEKSEFWNYFKSNFETLKLKKLIATHYNPNGKSYKLEISKDNNIVQKTILSGNGNFNSEECVTILKESDVIITNPPFSLMREFVALLLQYNKDFLIVAPITAVSYKEVFPYFKNDVMFVGHNFIYNFYNPQGEKVRIGNGCWIGTLKSDKDKPFIELTTIYKDNKDTYIVYDNFDAINIPSYKEIPCDYTGVMGVPITFLKRYNPKQFKIVGFRKGNDGKDLRYKETEFFSRVLIQRR